MASSASSRGSPANLASSPSETPFRSNTSDNDNDNNNPTTSIPFSSSMSSTTSSLSQYSLYQPQQISPNHHHHHHPGTYTPPASSSLPERESSLPISPNPNTFTQPSDEQTPQAPSNPQLQKLMAHSGGERERERDLRRISTESARSSDTYGAPTTTGSSSISGSRMGPFSFEQGGGKGSVPLAASSSSSGTPSQQQQQQAAATRPKIGHPGGTPLFDLSSASQFAGPPTLDVVDLSTSPQQQQQYQPSTAVPASTNLAGLAQSPHRGLAASSSAVSNPTSAAAAATSTTTIDYLSTSAASGNQSPVGDIGMGVGIGMGTGLGIGMPQQGEMMMMPPPSAAPMGPRTPAASGGAGGGGGGVQMTFDEGLLRTLCDLDVSPPPAPPPFFLCLRSWYRVISVSYRWC
ncbi:hypothetical protein QFC24_001744 [Naganishia onofrii]|uniref:Uncharacterized protein n=1 Tax=Naganishia onofrii TaxID=1851511 RepID=A0ACC2XRQ7_9TREE|nr:hypothetical protein QFC24_001744 [Naganishia onofrii]